MQIDVTYAQSVSSLPSGFVTDINYVVNYLDSLFPNNVTLNIEVSYQNLGSGILGESEASQYVSESYSAVRNALQAEGAPGAAALPPTSPLPTSTLSMSIAEAQALGLAASSGIFDGEVFFTNQYQWSYSQTATPGANQFYFIGVVEHEITEVMGRVSLDGDGGYSPMDLYRYSAPGVRDTTTGGSGSTAYFSLDNGTTNLGSWNNQPSNGDLGDWYPQGPAPGGNDAFNDDSSPGVINVVSSSDIALMQAIGWAGTPAPPPQGPTVTAVMELPSTGIVNAGKVVTITVDLSGTVTVAGGTPTLMLNDGGTASFSSGSGTDALNFSYMVLAGQNTNDLLISSIDLNGATVTDGSGNNANFSNLTNVAPAGTLQVYTTPTASVSASSFTVSLHQAVAASTFFSIANPNGDSITQYSFEDNGGGSGHFTVGGSVEPNGQAFTVSAGNLSSVQYVGGFSAGTDTLIVDAYDATAAAWMPSVSVNAVSTAPSASVSVSSFTVFLHQAVAASTFFSIANPNGDSITQYSFEDSGGGSGYFTVGGSVEPNGQAFTVSAANLSSVQYVGGSSAGTDTLTVDAYDATAAAWVPSVSLSAVTYDVIAQTIQNDFFGITREDFSSDQASVVVNSINAGTQTEAQYVNGLLSQVADTTIPAVAVEGSMYGVVGTSAEITFLATQFLPAQLGWATQHGFSPEVFACQVLGLAFAFGNENGANTFADNFGPSNAAMPNTPTGDAAFAAAVASAVFGSAANAGTATNILGWVSYFEAYFTQNGIPGIANPTTAQIDLAARGTAWGDAVGVAVANNLGPLAGQTTNFLEDAAQGTAIYSASLTSQPNHAPFQGASSALAPALDSSITGLSVGLTGVADHIHTGLA